MWDREPTVEEIVRRLWQALAPELANLHAVSLEEANEFDRCRMVTLTATS